MRRRHCAALQCIGGDAAKGVLLMPVPELQQLAGIARGARRDGYRDRKDRY